MLKLYSYWRSSAAYRVRIGLNLKRLAYEIVPIHLVRDGGQQHAAAYRALNPMRSVPTLCDGPLTLTQSLAILEYLEERYPAPPLLPADPGLRAQARALALLVAGDIHPLNNLRVLQYLSGELAVADDAKMTWYRHWVSEGCTALEEILRGRTEGPYALGPDVTLADLCLVPQLYNARRFHVELADFPTLVAIETACLALEAFRRAAPEVQPDAE